MLVPDVVLRSDFRPKRPRVPREYHGAAAVAGQALIGAFPAAQLHSALVNGAAGTVVTVHGRPFAIMAFTVAGGKIVEIDVIVEGDRIRRVAANILSNP